MINEILVDSVALVLLRKVYLTRNIFRKIELIQPVLIPKSYNIRKTAKVHYRIPMRHSHTFSRFIGHKFPPQVYTTYAVSNTYLY